MPMPIELRGIYKFYDGHLVLENISHTFRDNGITCILGPSGCGKTTLLRILLGLTAPDSGIVQGLNGRTAAAVFQEDRLLENLTPVENLALVLRRGYPKQDIERALCAVHLESALHQPVRTLSGGMKRRIAIVRALLTDAEILMLDEPIKGLDSQTRALVLEYMLPLLKNRTVLWVTHDPAEVEALHADVWEMTC